MLANVLFLKKIRILYFLPLLVIFALCSLQLPAAFAATVTIAWDKNTETDVIGYKFYYGTVSKNYQYTVDVKNNTSCSISGLTEGTRYYFAAKAYNDKNIESSYSEELAHTISITPPPPPPLQNALTVDTVGGGSVVLDPPGGTYSEGTLVQLTAVAGPGSAFNSWSGDITGSANPVTITMDSDINAMATFTESAYIYSETFNAYTAGSDPADWLDTAAHNSMAENDSLFEVFDLNGDKVFGTTSTQTNIHSHLTGPGIDTLSAYEYSGRMMITASNGGIGVTFFSQYPNTDAYYRLKREYDNGVFHIAPHGTNVTGDIVTGVVPSPNIWYWFRILVEDTGSRTEIRAKVWPENSAEPAAWQVDCYDESSSRLTAGTAGVWSYLSGSKYWDDLTVTPLGSPPLQFALNLDTVGDGSVELDPPGGTYNEKTVVQLTAVAVPGSTFDSWSGDITGSANPVTVTMDADMYVAATFTEVVIEIPKYSLTVDADGSGDVILDPAGGFFEQGTQVMLTASPEPGWKFTGWSGDLSGSANPATITMDADKTVTANFVAIPQFTLTANTVGDGSVELDPPAVTYNEGTVVQLTATAAAGWEFTGWNGDLSGSANPATIVMTADRNITATFSATTQHILDVTTVGNGWVSADPDQAEYDLGQLVTLTATADPGWVFTGWSDDLSGISNPTTLTITGDRQVTATFVDSTQAYAEDFEVYTDGDDPADWLDTAANNSMAENDSLFEVFDFGGEKVYGTDSTQTNIHSHHTGPGVDTLSAYEYTGRMMITSSNGGIGITFFSQYPNEDAYYRLRRYNSNAFHISPHGTKVTGDSDTGVVPLPNMWYRFKIQVEDTGSQTEIRAKVWQDGTGEPADWQANVIDTSSSRLFAGTFGLWSYYTGSKYWDDLTVTPLGSPPPQYALTVDTVGDGSVELNPPAGTYNEEAVVQLTASAAAGWEFTGWNGDITGTDNPVTVTMDADMYVAATFTEVVIEIPKYSLTVDADGSGNVIFDPAVGFYEQGTRVILTASPEPGWEFIGWSGDLGGSANPVTIVITGDHQVTATFADSTQAYAEDFEDYTDGDDPVDWLDTAAKNSMVENDSLFEVFDLNGDQVFGTTSTQTNIHSHHTGPGIDLLSGYEYTGRMMITDPQGGIGVTFFSQYPNKDAYYRLRRYKRYAFHISPHGTKVTGDSDTGVVPSPNVWYWFRILVEDTGSRTEIRAKVWPENSAEPADWQVDCYDESRSRLTTGTIGAWGYYSGSKYWDDLAANFISP